MRHFFLRRVSGGTLGECVRLLQQRASSAASTETRHPLTSFKPVRTTATSSHNASCSRLQVQVAQERGGRRRLYSPPRKGKKPWSKIRLQPCTGTEERDDREAERRNRVRNPRGHVWVISAQQATMRPTYGCVCRCRMGDQIRLCHECRTPTQPFASAFSLLFEGNVSGQTQLFSRRDTF